MYGYFSFTPNALMFSFKNHISVFAPWTRFCKNNPRPLDILRAGTGIKTAANMVFTKLGRLEVTQAVEQVSAPVSADEPLRASYYCQQSSIAQHLRPADRFQFPQLRKHPDVGRKRVTPNRQANSYLEFLPPRNQPHSSTLQNKG